MMTRKLFIHLFVLFFCCASFCSGQVFGPGRNFTWNSNLKIEIEGSKRLLVENMDPNGYIRKMEHILPEPGRYALGWGKLWRIKPGVDGHLIYSTSDGKNWLFEGRLRSFEVPHHFVPLCDDRMLVTGWKHPLIMGHDASAMGVFSRSDNGDYKLETLVHPFSKTWYRPIAKARPDQPQEDPALFELRKEYRLFTFHSLAMSHYPFRALPEGAAFISLWTGDVWIFNARGSIIKKIQIFNKPTESDWPRLLSFEPVLLGVVPTVSGELLLVSRSEDAVLEARKKYPSMVYDAEGKTSLFGGRPDTAAANQVRSGFLFPKLVWWTLDPRGDSGLKRLEVEPQGAPAELPSTEEGAQAWIQGFTFTVDRFGAVKVLGEREPTESGGH